MKTIFFKVLRFIFLIVGCVLVTMIFFFVLFIAFFILNDDTTPKVVDFEKFLNGDSRVYLRKVFIEGKNNLIINQPEDLCILNNCFKNYKWDHVAKGDTRRGYILLSTGSEIVANFTFDINNQNCKMSIDPSLPDVYDKEIELYGKPLFLIKQFFIQENQRKLQFQKESDQAPLPKKEKSVESSYP